jgi:hypothetical protein
VLSALTSVELSVALRNPSQLFAETDSINTIIIALISALRDIILIVIEFANHAENSVLNVTRKISVKNVILLTYYTKRNVFQNALMDMLM